MMTLVRNLIHFSKNGEYLAYSSPDGCLKIWETASNILKQEYTPSSHLSATCSSLSWAPFSDKNKVPKKLKKSKNESFSGISSLRLIAMGTMAGDILLYSFANADLHTSLSNGHTSAVNDVVWHSNMLYSCSRDQHIIIWDITSGRIKTKWKAFAGAVHSICVIDDNNLLAANNSIQWWDIKQNHIIKTFNGHATEIFKLVPLISKGDDNIYFLSAAVDDRFLNVWHLKENSSTSAVSSFVLSDEPSYIDILAKPKQHFQLSVVSQDGIFHFFEHSINGKTKKPLQPKFTIQIASKVNDSQKASSLPILASSISNELDFCLLSYGNFLKPTFERINISDISKDMFLIRDISKSSSAFEDNVTRIKQTEKPNNVKMLAPGHMTDVNFSKSISKKRKKKDLDIKELPMEERLKALDLSKNPKEISDEDFSVKSESMVHLLLQGLQSKDNNMLNKVLQCSDELVIQRTIERLPIQSIFSLLKVLYERLNKRELKSHPCLKWFIALLSIHLSYFMSCQDISEYLIPFDQLISAKKEIIYKLTQAQGILRILLAQAASSTSNTSEAPTKPLLEYESESSEESDAEADPSDNSFEDKIVDNTSSESSEISSDSEDEMED